MSAPPTQCIAYRHNKFATIWSSLSEDILRYLNKSPENQAAGDTFKTRLGAFLTPQLLCLLFYRIAHYLYVKGWRRLAVGVSRLNCLVHKVTIPPQSCIGPACFLPHPAGVTFCGTAGNGLTLYSLAVCCPLGAFLSGPVENAPRLKDRVTVGAHAVLLGPITVGDDTKVAFSLRVDRDVPAGVLVISKALRVTMRSPNAERAAQP